MAQIFKPSADTWLRFGLVAVLAAAVLLVLFWTEFAESAWRTRVGWAVEQPVPFSHEHHVGGLGIDCRYCHITVEKSASAGFPPTHVCMTCHSQIWTKAEMLAPVRESYATGHPIAWERVASVPDYVFFNHAIHIDRGVPCVACHGRIDRMPLTKPAHGLQMEFCLGCHRDPANRLRPRDMVTRMAPPQWSEAEHRAFALAAARKFHLDPHRLDKCDICHR